MPEEFRFRFDADAMRRRTTEFRTVEVSDQPVSAVIVRDGEQVRAPTVKKGTVEDLLTRLTPVGRTATPRVLSQSLPPGTYVARGTPIDLVLVRSSDVTLGILENVHSGLMERSVEDLLPAFDNPLVKNAVRKGEASKVSDEEKEAIEEALNRMGVQIDEQDNEKTFEKAYNSLQGARAFL